MFLCDYYLTAEQVEHPFLIIAIILAQTSNEYKPLNLCLGWKTMVLSDIVICGVGNGVGFHCHK
jgi:hypothetical protein